MKTISLETKMFTLIKDYIQPCGKDLVSFFNPSMVLYKGKVDRIIYQLKGGLKSSMGYIGAKDLKSLQKKSKFVKITKAGFYESMVHNVEVTGDGGNYRI